MVRLGLWVFRRKTTEIMWYSHHVISRVHTMNLTYGCVTLDHLAEAVFVRFLHVKLLFFHPPCSALLGRKSLHEAHAEGVGYLLLLGGGLATEIIWNSSAQNVLTF